MPDLRKCPSSQPNDDDRGPGPDNAVARDQRERRYYYDDAHGYEDFDPNSEPEEDEDEAAS